MADFRRRFLEGVTSHIRSAEARDFVSRELNEHINGEKKNLLGNGMSEQEAEETAIKQMGSPTELGQDLNKIHRPKIDWWLTGLFLLTIGFSFLPMFMWNGIYFTKMKVVITIIGIAVTLSLMLVDYKRLYKFKWLFFGVGAVILLLLSLVPSSYIYGTPSFNIGPLTIESTMALPFFYLGWAILFSENRMKVWKAAGLYVVTVLLFLQTINLSLVLIYSMMVFVMMWCSKLGVKKKAGVTGCSLLVVLVYGLLFLFTTEEYHKERLLAFINPGRFADSGGIMYIRLKETLSQAGWFGQFGKQEFIPSGHTDLVFASITYQFGWGIGLLLFTVLTLLMARMILVVSKVKDTFGKMLIVGGITLFTVQFLYNVGMIVGILPLIGISLPFISYGLMPTVLNAVVIGIVLSVYRRKELNRTAA